MRMTYAVHILAGTLGLLTGYVALYAAKGGTVHKKSGMLFVYTMVTMCVFGMLIAMVTGVAPAINIPAGVLTAYLVITALTTVHPSSVLGSRPSAIGLMLVALTLGVTDLTFGFQAIANGGTRNGMPAFPFVMFGIAGTIAALGDIRVMKSGALTGARRLARHLWRMCFALFIAALSASVQFSRMVPRPLRIPVMVVPMLVALVAMVYWLWRVRRKRSLRGIVSLRVAEAI
jgi:uncharacterized membrane protein